MLTFYVNEKKKEVVQYKLKRAKVIPYIKACFVESDQQQHSVGSRTEAGRDCNFYNESFHLLCRVICLLYACLWWGIETYDNNRKRIHQRCSQNDSRCHCRRLLGGESLIFKKKTVFQCFRDLFRFPFIDSLCKATHWRFEVQETNSKWGLVVKSFSWCDQFAKELHARANRNV